MYKSDTNHASSGQTAISWRQRPLESLSRQELQQAIGQLIAQDWQSLEAATNTRSRSFFLGLVVGLCASAGLSLLALIL
jgi:hypothetical protein